MKTHLCCCSDETNGTHGLILTGLCVFLALLVLTVVRSAPTTDNGRPTQLSLSKERTPPTITKTGNWIKRSQRDSLTDESYAFLHLAAADSPLQPEIGRPSFLEVCSIKGDLSTLVFLGTPAKIYSFDPDEALLHSRFDSDKAKLHSVRVYSNGQSAELPRKFIEQYKTHSSLLLVYSTWAGGQVELRFNLLGFEEALKELKRWSNVCDHLLVRLWNPPKMRARLTPESSVSSPQKAGESACPTLSPGNSETVEPTPSPAIRGFSTVSSRRA